MKFPKSVIIAGRPFKVVFKAGLGGAQFSSMPGLIEVGPHPDGDERLVWFLHEVLESIMTQRMCRYDSYPDRDSSRFVMTHAEFSNIVRDLVLAIKPMLRKSK